MHAGPFESSVLLHTAMSGPKIGYDTLCYGYTTAPQLREGNGQKTSKFELKVLIGKQQD